MFQLIPITLDDKSIIEGWLKSELTSESELQFYKNFSNWFPLLSENRLGWIFLENNNKIGFVDLEKDLENFGHFSFYLTKTERKKRKSEKLLLSLIQKGIELGLLALVAGVNKNNIPSQKSLESIGFIQKGTDKDGYINYFFKLNK